MTREELLQLIKQEIVILDGATGTNLMAAGMPVGVCPEQWILEHRQVMLDLQKAYVKAGTKILLAPTFTANRIKLSEYELEDELVKMNRDLVAISKEAAGETAFVAGDLTMTGRQLYPMGELHFEELVEVYKEQIRVLCDAGVDLLIVETMMSLQEARAAVIAAKETTELPVMVSMTYEADGRTLYGTDPKTATVVLQSLGADVIGLNCSTGPEGMIEPVRQMAEAAYIPILAKPNAGLPELIDGNTVYQTEPEEFAEIGAKLVDEGANVIGGCCGTTPEHIAALKNAVEGKPAYRPKEERRRLLASERKTVEITLDGPFMVVGERINPTGKKKLQAELREGGLNLVRTMAREQEENGAVILDVNMGMNGIDEKQMMLETIYEVTGTVDCPLSIDSSHVDIIEAALRIYPGRALINSISYEKEKFEKLLQIAKKYGAMFILLPLSDEGIPETVEEKRQIVRTILEAALAIGLRREDIVVDGLVATVGANPKAALECFDTIRYCKEELGLATICGLSNISFGLPARQYVNTAFLTMAIAKGLTMAIANPSQELLMNAAFSADLLLHKEEGDIRYINRMNRLENRGEGNGSSKNTGTAIKTGPDGNPLSPKELAGSNVFDMVLQGNKESILGTVDCALAEGIEPGEIINAYLIPAINEVGVLFDKQVYFLPQLIASAKAMEQAIGYLEPMLSRDGAEDEMATIVIATVEGDIHDIGKNLVALMLKNYGYRVIDLGKDVAADTIIGTAMDENAAVIGLSALMTTTMMRMKDVVELAKERGCRSKIIVGGAAISQSFADEIGADGYSKDAAECVKLVERLLSEKADAVHL